MAAAIIYEKKMKLTELQEMTNIDIKENNLYRLDSRLLEILLIDRTAKKNLIWATDNYASRGVGYQSGNQISVFSIIKRNGSIIKPRVEKSKKEQSERIKSKAEVFTPSWICNAQNNLIDNAWFERENAFNIEIKKGWVINSEKISFPVGKTWQDYVKENRLEITCGEAPYLVSRYDTVTGEEIPIKERIGLLDRKLRIVSENVDSEPDWVDGQKRHSKAFTVSIGKATTSCLHAKTYCELLLTTTPTNLD